MNTLARSCAKPITPSSRERLPVTVVFLGRDDFHTDLPEIATLRQLKLLALVHFGLEPEAADRYVLRNHGTNCSDEQSLAILGERPVSLTLVAAAESGRFGEALFLR